MPANWLGAALPVVAQTVLLAIAGSLVNLRMHAEIVQVVSGVDGTNPLFSPAFGVILAIFSVVAGTAMVFWLAAGALVVLDILFAGSGQSRRLVECCALAYWSQVPWSLIGLVILSIWGHPEPIRIPTNASPSELTTLLVERQAHFQSMPVMQTVQLVGVYFGLWLVGLQATALRVVSGFSVRGAWAAGIVLGTLFVALPYVAQRIW